MAVVCAIIYFSSKRTSESRLMHNQLFRWLILCVFALLILESFTWILDGSKSKSAILFNYLVTISLYLLTPLPSFLWELYVKLQLFPDPKSVRTDVLAFGIPIAVSYVLTLTSPFTNLMFALTLPTFITGAYSIRFLQSFHFCQFSSRFSPP